VDPSSTILPLLFFLAGTRSPSSNQSSLPWMKSLSLASGRDRFIMAKRKPPLSSPLIYLPCRKYSMLREVPRKRCSGFLAIPDCREMANIESYHPEPICPAPDVASQHQRLIIRYEGSIGCLAIRPSRANSTPCRSPSSPSSSPIPSCISKSGILG
jgi:hypothetical protein